MNEIAIIINPQAGVIDFNAAEIKAAIAEELEAYKNASFTEESKQIAKSTVAYLRSSKKALDDRRKDVKKKYMEPYEKFESEVKEVLTLFDEPITFINDQVKTFDEAVKQKKREKIQQTYDECIGIMREYLPLEKIYNPQWENVSVTMKKVADEIQQHVNNARMAVDMISGMRSDAVPEALQIYKNTLDMSMAISHINQYEANKARVLEYERERILREEEAKHQREIERIRQEERKRVEDERRIREEAQKEIVEELTAPITDGIIECAPVTAVYTVSASETDLAELEIMMDSLGIVWSRKGA